MPFTETVTIINNSGKVISTGKQLVGIFKEAKAAYKDKKEALKAERAAAAPGIKRAQTFDAAYVDRQQYYEYDYDHEYAYDRAYDPGRRRSQDDGHSLASSRRSHRSKRSHRHRSSSQSRPALTESNLQTLSEVSATTPSVAPRAYRSPYAETAPRDMALSRPTLLHSATMPMPPPSVGASRYPPSTVYNQPRGPAAPSVTNTSSPVSTPRQSMLVHRPRSESHLRKSSKDIDMHLAYGNIPPDLESRTDLISSSRSGPLEPMAAGGGGYHAASQEVVSSGNDEQQAITLMQRIESFLEEAHCLQHTAGAIITHLQSKPEAAAAVALTLAELSSLLTKMSPGFLAVIKGGSPAVFSLLASPQFLIGAGVAVGVTVVMFGGWKIVKRIQEAKKEAEKPVEFEMQSGLHQQQPPPPQPAGGYGFAQGAAFGRAAGSDGFDEALVLEEELSTIESWRRGIAAYGDEGTADLELISPEAERAMREQRKSRHKDDITPDDSASRCGRTERSSRSHKSHKSRRHRDDNGEIPERKSSKGFKERDDEDDDGDRSERSHRSHRSSRSKRTERVTTKAIEDGSRDSENTVDAVLRKDKKPNMLKTLFKKKKDKDEREKVEVSVLA